MAIKNFQCARHFLVSIIWPTMVDRREKFFKLKILRTLENAILRLAFTNAVFDEITILPMFLKAKFTSVSDI